MNIADVRCGARLPLYFYNNASAPHMHLENLDKSGRGLDGCIHERMTAPRSVVSKTKPRRLHRANYRLLNRVLKDTTEGLQVAAKAVEDRAN